MSSTNTNPNEDKRFNNKYELENWLKGRGVDEDDAGKAAETLFKEGRGVTKSTQLLNISSDQLERLGVSILLSVELSNKLKDQRPSQRPYDLRRQSQLVGDIEKQRQPPPKGMQQQQQPQKLPRNEAENDAYKTPRQNSQQGKQMSPTLKKALGKLKENKIDLDDLPTDNLHPRWSAIEKKLDLEPLELTALQNYRKRLEEQNDHVVIPIDIGRTIIDHHPRPQREQFESTRLHPTISTLYTHNKDRPDFLTFRLGQHNYSDEATRGAIQETMKSAPVCVAGVSGAGKTRTVLEILSTQWGIYFSSGVYLSSTPQPYKPCSSDLAWIAEDSAEDMEFIYAKTVQRLKCAVVARLLILEKKIEMEGKKFTFLDWVLMQLYPPIINQQRDVFLVLTQHLYRSHAKIAGKIEKVLERVPHLFKCIVVDEAQVAMQQNKERYDNVNKTNKHPFLYAVIRCLWKIGQDSGMCPILCGTGISIMKMSSVAISAVGDVQNQRARCPADKYKMLVPISTVLEPQSIKLLVKEILVSQVCEPHQVGLWSRTLVGRPRILWGFLSLALTGTDGVDDVFKQYCGEMTSGQGMGDALTTLYSCVEKALARRATGETNLSQSIGSAVSDMVVNWLTGQTPPELEEEEKVDWIVDCGVCILERKVDKTKLVARLREPLVVQAYLEYIKKSSPDLILKTIMAKLETATEPSSQGFLFEILFYFALQKWLNGKSLHEAGFAPSDPTSCGFLHEVCDIPLESISNSLLRLPETPDGSGVGLQSQFLDCHRLYLECATNRPRPRAAATPAKKDTDDLVVVALTEKHVLIFLIQCKLEKNTDYLKAAQTTFPGLLLHQSKKRKRGIAVHGRSVVSDYDVLDANKVEYQALQDLLGSKKWGARTVCVVQLVVAYPATVSKLGDTRWISTPPQPCHNSDELAELLKRVPKEGEEKRLLVVVKEKMLQQLLGKNVFDRLEAVKEVQKAGEEQNVDVAMSLSDLLPYEDGASTVEDKKESD